MPQTVVVIPCYNEEARLNFHGFSPLLADAEVGLLFVNDGSRDGTLTCLKSFQDGHPGRVEVMDLPVNGGKAEAVRHGMLKAMESEAEITGYLDADLATSAEEFHRMLQVIRSLPSETSVLLGARVRLLGRDIQRSPTRHILGRIFATAASLILGLPIYDTQCGAKVFRRTPALLQALSVPFSSRWIFDVELLGRLVRRRNGAPPIPLSAIKEEPLLAWKDIKGSKLGPMAMLRAAVDLTKIRRQLRIYSRS